MGVSASIIGENGTRWARFQRGLLTESSETKTAIWQGGIVVDNDTRGGGQGGVAVVTGCPRPSLRSKSKSVGIVCGLVAACGARLQLLDPDSAYSHVTSMFVCSNDHLILTSLRSATR